MKSVEEWVAGLKRRESCFLSDIIREALAAQREADARICEGLLGPMWTSRECADKIREQGKET